MKIKEYTLEATIGLPEYSNVKPSITLSDVEDFEAAHNQATAYLDKVWAQYGKQLPKVGGDRQKLEAFVGGEIYYDDATHTYTNEAGEVYLSGSQYAAQFSKPFDKQRIATAMAAKFKVSAQEILDMWELSADASKGLGTAIHAAMELWGKYSKISTLMEKTSHISKSPILSAPAVSFYESRGDEKAEYEIFVVDHATKRAGQIDRLLITGPKRCRVQDFKTNGELTKDKLAEYFEQLKFYGEIMQANGWEVEPPEIHHWSGIEWITHTPKP